MLYITTALKKIAACNKKIVIVQGGARAGKTMAILMLMIDYLVQHSERKGAVFSFSYPHLKRGAITDSLKIIKEIGQYKNFAYNKTDKTYVFENGSQLQFITADNIQNVQGVQYDITFANEARYISQDMINQIILRAIYRCYIDFNPTNKFYVHELLAIRDDCEFIKLTYKDNEACPKEIVEELERIDRLSNTSSYWKNYAKVFVHGEIGGSIDAVFPDWRSVDKVPANAKLVCVGVDFGFMNDVTAIVAVYYKDDSFIVDELAYRTRMLTKDIADVVKDYQCPIYCDGAEPRTIVELNIALKSNRAQGVKFKISESIDIINRQVIYVTSHSTNIQTEQMNYVYRRDKFTGELTNEPIDANNHAMDAIRYAICGHLQKKYTYIKNF